MLGGSALLIAIVLWFDNAQGGLTGNGVFKSLELKPWVSDPANAPLYPSNYLYLSALRRALPAARSRWACSPAIRGGRSPS